MISEWLDAYMKAAAQEPEQSPSPDQRNASDALAELYGRRPMTERDRMLAMAHARTQSAAEGDPMADGALPGSALPGAAVSEPSKQRRVLGNVEDPSARYVEVTSTPGQYAPGYVQQMGAGVAGPGQDSAALARANYLRDRGMLMGDALEWARRNGYGS